MKTLILLGGGGHAAVAAETARAAGFVVEGYLDDSPPKPESVEVLGFRHIGALANIRDAMATHRHANFHAAVGDPDLRKKWLEAAAPRLIPPIVHPCAVISPSAKIADGAYVGANAVINARAKIGRGVIINTGSIIEHDCILGDFCHIAPGSVVAGSVKIGEAAMVGAGSRIIPGVRIGARATLGAGAVAVEDIPEGVTAAGVPARVLKASDAGSRC